jgi:hypothetical protein
MPRSRRTNDPDGREVVLDLRTERHLRRRRPEMISHIPAILNTVERPDAREDDVVAGERGSSGEISIRLGGSGWL